MSAKDHDREMEAVVACLIAHRVPTLSARAGLELLAIMRHLRALLTGPESLDPAVRDVLETYAAGLRLMTSMAAVHQVSVIMDTLEQMRPVAKSEA